METGQDIVAAAPVAAMGAPPPTSLAPGFRFHPTDEELVRYYLRRKVCGMPFRFEAISEIDVYKSEPWELDGCYVFQHSVLKTRDLEWYFFNPVDKKYGSGSRLNRTTGQGYWKATGKDRPVKHKNESIGMKKTLVFHSGRIHDGKRTDWVMHEYRLCDTELGKAGVLQDAFVLCKIFHKSGARPPNGDRYAPFIEEEWDEDAPLVVPAEDEVREDCTNTEQDVQPLVALADTPGVPLQLSKRDPAPELEHLSLDIGKRPKRDDPNCSIVNGSEDSTSTMMMAKTNSPPVEIPLLETLGAKGNLPGSTTTFNSAELEKSVPPGYLKFISNLEKEIIDISMDRERLKIEVMRAQAMIDILQSRVEPLTKENAERERHSFEGNTGLYGFPLNGSFNNPHQTGPLPSRDSEPKDEEIEWEYVFAAFGYVVGFGSIAWTLLCFINLREIYFEKIEEVADKIFFERGRRRRHERRSKNKRRKEEWA
ncbi:NAC domain containing protein 50-like [Salvia hispanica]|uniref:NAC domain containing protein 50-like n=1 Tax=Salvia hispanica TaxID=49212 RepID=UPI002009A9C0|nr:NAC domain containing protein 50-like [Salvia hispanica]